MGNVQYDSARSLVVHCTGGVILVFKAIFRCKLVTIANMSKQIKIGIVGSQVRVFGGRQEVNYLPFRYLQVQYT